VGTPVLARFVLFEHQIRGELRCALRGKKRDRRSRRPKKMACRRRGIVKRLGAIYNRSFGRKCDIETPRRQTGAKHRGKPNARGRLPEKSAISWVLLRRVRQRDEGGGGGKNKKMPRQQAGTRTVANFSLMPGGGGAIMRGKKKGLVVSISLVRGFWGTWADGGEEMSHAVPLGDIGPSSNEKAVIK